MKKSIVPLLLRVALGGIFIYAAIPKIADPVTFAGSVAAYQILPYFWNYVAAATLPFVELVCGVFLITGVRVRTGALIIGGLNLLFIAALSSAIVRGLDIDCGCFRQGGPKTSPWIAVARDTVFLIATAALLRYQRVTAK